VTVVSADTVQVLAASGLKNAVPSPSMGIVQGWIAPGDVSALAALNVVTRITLPQYAAHL
jgi:tetrahydromethanopterin S-methyltransferase subunit C